MISRLYQKLVLIAMCIAMLIIGVDFFYKEWRLYNIYGAEAAARANMFPLIGGSFLDKLYGVNIFDQGKGLDVVSLSIPEKSSKGLVVDFPASLKKWQPAFMLYRDGVQRPVKVRIRGDNPINWAYEKKSWRVKTEKKNLIDRRRVINYAIPQDGNLLDTYLSYYIGGEAGLLTPENRMVELVVNGKSQGMYFEYSHVDEGFLRRNDQMPVNLYKGEQYHTERSIDRSNDLFNNPYLWTKTSVFNQRPDENHDDLKYMLDVLRNSETSGDYYKLLTRVADINAWAKFAAFQTLIQSWHNDNHHNMRLLSDVWKGSVVPVVHDTGSDFSDEANASLIYELSPHSLFMTYNKSSEFLSKKYKYLYQFINEDLLLKAADHIEELKSQLKPTWDRDLYHTQHSISSGLNANESSLDVMETKWNKLIGNINERQNLLKSGLENMPDVSWLNNDNGFSIIVTGVVPVGEVTFNYDGVQEVTEIAYDKDGDGVLSSADLRLPFTVKNNTITLHAEFYSNRVLVKDDLDIYGLMYPKTRLADTQFNFVSNAELNVNNVTVTNILTGEIATSDQVSLLANTPSKMNVPVIRELSDKEIWSGDMVMGGVTFVDYPVDIEAGTVVRLEDKASIIFTDKVMVKGTHDKPVVFTGIDDNTIWGALALHGKDTEGSSITNMVVSQGSGYISDDSVYSAMFSIHDTSNIDINALTLYDNHIFDDMMHIVYAKGIVIDKCKLDNSYSDAMDIDISEVEINNCTFHNSGNDGIDLMSSKAKIRGTLIDGSGDKGISIGEASNALVFDTLISRNKIGIESKDGSVSRVIHSELVDNEIQINAYSKNWHYGSGGDHYIFKSVLTSAVNELGADKKSSINIYDSEMRPVVLKYPKNVSLINEKLAVESFSEFMPGKWLDELSFHDGSNGRLKGH